MTRLTAITTVLALLVLTGSAWTMDGSGTPADPYIITNVDELQAMRENLSAHYQLGNDIDASTTASWNGGAGFEPVGDDANVFTGVFDGQGRTITGLHINRGGTDAVGLFGSIRDGAEVKNVGLLDVDITARRNSGPLVGASSGGSISGCWSSGTITGSYDYQMRLGGLIGISSGADSFVSHSYSSVTVVATGGAHQVGGLAGYNGHGSVMSDCYATGDVAGSYKVGGLVGDNVEGSEGTLIIRCYSTGRVTGSGGGLVGFNWRGGVTQDSYWDRETSGKTSSSGGEPKTTAQMMQQATFVNWNFDEVWDIIENQTYPFFVEPRVLEGFEIVGPDEAAENHQTQYHAIAHYDNSSTKDVTDSAVWSVEPTSLGDINAGLLTTESLSYYREDIKIYAQYTEDANTVDAEKDVSVFAICTSGGALEFDGVDDYVEMTENVELQGLGGQKFTLSSWIYPTSMHSIVSVIRNDHDYNLFIRNRNLKAEAFHSNILYYAETDGISINENNWYHIACVWDGSDFELYVNGQFESSTTLSTNYYMHDYPLWIGRSSRYNEPFPGVIDDVQIYNRALSAEEIRENLHNTLTGTEPNLVAYWPLDEGAGQVAHDLSANANNGYLGSDPCAPDSKDPVWVDSDAPVEFCTLGGFVERYLSEALESKLNSLEEIDSAMTMEKIALDALDRAFQENDHDDLRKRDVVVTKQKIHSAMRHQQQSVDSLEKGITKVEESLTTMDGD